MQKSNKINEINKIFIIFMIGSIIGYIVEMIVAIVQKGHLESRQGVIYGPLTPIYGVGIIAYYLCFKKIQTRNKIKVFLISLKAGGTGLNLTGADMVIHYDPWWNQSAENQATDRAYRIGQKNNVQVYKLITTNSIEEKIYELQNKKAKLVDNMLDTKTSFINKFSKDEIMSLFE